MIIASRILKLRQRDGDADIAVRIYAPRSDGVDWTCAYEIDWPDRTRKGYAGGLDAVQALFHALQMIGIEIYTSEYHEAGVLSWDKPGQGYGFPVTANARDLLIGDDAKYY
jgi:uncharacterized protein DUF6968